MTTTEIAVPAVATGGNTATVLAPTGALTPSGEAMARLGEWVQLGEQAHALVSRLASSAFIPAAYRTGDAGTVVANATAAVLYGLSLGWDPMTSLQQVYIVHGRPGLYAKAKVALLQSRGYEVATLELTDTTATVAVRRPGQAEHDKPVTITMADAERAGWTSNAAYKKTPADMLWARAAGRACDRSGAAVLLGIATVEDIPDDAEPIRAEATVTASPLRGADLIAGQPTEQQAGPVAVVTGPATGQAREVWRDEAPVHDLGDAPASTEQFISGPQSRKLHTLLGKTGRGDRAEGLRYLTLFLGREITTSKELTRVEANRVIEDLTLQVDEPGESLDPAGEPHMDPAEAQ